jgi:hypothetical protein
LSNVLDTRSWTDFEELLLLLRSLAISKDEGLMRNRIRGKKGALMVSSSYSFSIAVGFIHCATFSTETVGFY